MFNFLKKIFPLFLAVSFLAFSFSVFAIADLDNTSIGGTTSKNTSKVIATAANYSTTSAIDMVNRVIQIILGLSGTVALVMVMMAGYNYLMSKGDSKKISKAMSQIFTGIIGIVLIVLSYSISNFILKQLVQRAAGDAVVCGSIKDQTACSNNGCTWGTNGGSTLACYDPVIDVPETSHEVSSGNNSTATDESTPDSVNQGTVVSNDSGDTQNIDSNTSGYTNFVVNKGTCGCGEFEVNGSTYKNLAQKTNYYTTQVSKAGSNYSITTTFACSPNCTMSFTQGFVNPSINNGTCMGYYGTTTPNLITYTCSNSESTSICRACFSN